MIITKKIKISFCVLLLIGCTPNAEESDLQACEKGTLDCSCRQGLVCDEGLVCLEGECKGTDKAGMQINAQDARSCEGVLQDNGKQIQSILFGDNKGTFQRRGKKVAFAFIRQEDSALENGEVELSLIGANAQDIRLLQSQCFNRLGQELEGSSIALQ